MTRSKPSPLLSAAITFGSIAGAILLRSLIDAYFHESINYGTFYLAVIVTSLYCGLRWGFASVLMSAATATLVLPPFGRPLVEEWTDLFGVVLFLFVAGVIVWLCDRVRQHRRVAEELAHERQELLIRERAAREEAERLNRAKDQFLAVVSHELRAPLQSILGWAQMLRDSQMTDEDVVLAADSIERGVRMQSQLINDLLDLSRIVMGKLRVDLRPIAFSESLQGAVQTLLPAARAKNVKIDVQCKCMGAVLGDHDRLQQVVWNLLSNAIKFTSKGGSIRATLSQEGESVVLAVADTGEGIAQDFLPYVFNRFQQADGERRREGLGLGLAIVKELVELHGGTVQARSAGKGKGAEFRIALPKHRPSAVAIEAEREPIGDQRVRDAALAGMQVLVIDDDPHAREVLKLVLGHYGADVVTAESVENANELMLSYHPDVVTCDLDMPEVSGCEFVSDVRRREGPAKSRLPVIALTACGDDVQGLEKGFQRRLIKPVEAWRLVKELAELANTSRRRR